MHIHAHDPVVQVTMIILGLKMQTDMSVLFSPLWPIEKVNGDIKGLILRRPTEEFAKKPE